MQNIASVCFSANWKLSISNLATGDFFFADFSFSFFDNFEFSLPPIFCLTWVFSQPPLVTLSNSRRKLRVVKTNLVKVECRMLLKRSNDFEKVEWYGKKQHKKYLVNDSNWCLKLNIYNLCIHNFNYSVS